MFKKLWAKIQSYFRRKVAPEANRAIVDPLRPQLKAAINKAADDLLLQPSLSLSTVVGQLKTALTDELHRRNVPAWLALSLVSLVDEVQVGAQAQQTATKAVEYVREYLLDRAANARF